MGTHDSINGIVVHVVAAAAAAEAAAAAMYFGK